jgi:hypothetical protein
LRNRPCVSVGWRLGEDGCEDRAQKHVKRIIVAREQIRLRGKG